MRISSLLVITALVASACGGATGVEASTSTSAPASTSTTTDNEGPDLSQPQEIPTALLPMASAWATDFSKATVDLDEILVGIPASNPRDLIRPIDEPRFDTAADTEWLTESEPGVMLDIGGDVRFYPLSVLTRHEIVNDEVGGMPVAVTYCPLCNTAVVFDREFEGNTLRLGVSGLLRHSDMVMWDDQTESLWQQITGEGIVGEEAGSQLTIIPASIVRWADFVAENPDGLAMSEDQGLGIRYGTNPYEFYSSRTRPFGFFQGEIDDRLPALERVVGVTVGETEKAYPFIDLQEIKVVNDEVNGQPVVVLWGAPDTADALDSFDLTQSRGIGTAVAYDPVVDGQTLTFEPAGEFFRDVETGSTWTILGTALDGDMAGSQLDLISHRNEFWFAWQAFFPEAEVWER